MGRDSVGYRFSPTGEELINYYLKNKIHGKTWLVDEDISEINICSYKPMSLPSLAKIKSNDPVWYFFCPIEYKSEKNKVTNRTTGSGFWKPTGKDRKIKDKRGKGVEIGLKKTLVYHEGKVPNAVRTPWIIHEYHITCLPQNQRTYVICQVMYNGKAGDILYGVNSTEPSQSLVSVSTTVRAISIPPEVSSVSEMFLQVEQPGEENIFALSGDDLVNPNTLFSDNINPDVQAQPQTPYDDNYFNRLLSNFSGENFEDVINTAPPQLQIEQNFNQQGDLFPNTSFTNPYVQPLTSEDDDFINGLLSDDGGDSEDQVIRLSSFKTKEFRSVITVDYSSESGSDAELTTVDYSSESGSDAESISATSYNETSTPDDSVGSSAEPSISRQTRESQLTRRTISLKQEVKHGMVKTKKKGWFNTEEAIQRKRENPHTYLDFIIYIICLMFWELLINDMLSLRS